MSPNHALQRTAPGGGGCRAISRLPRPQQSLSLGSLGRKMRRRFVADSVVPNGDLPRYLRFVSGAARFQVPDSRSLFRGVRKILLAGAPISLGAPSHTFFAGCIWRFFHVLRPNQSMSQRPHCVAHLACLPRHPAVAYLYFVRFLRHTTCSRRR